MELCAVVSSDYQTQGFVTEAAAWFASSVPTPLHLAVLLRLNLNYGGRAKLTSELAEEFAGLGWCTPEQYVHATGDLIGRGLAEGVQLRVNPLFHTGDECARCLEHEYVYERTRNEFAVAMDRWEAGAGDYPYDTSVSKLHLRDCAYASGPPAPVEPSLREFVHGGDGYLRRLVLADDSVEVSWEELEEPGGVWWARSYGPPPGDVRRGGGRSHCLSIRETRAWATTGSGHRRSWKKCKVCCPIDPFLLDTADTTVYYRATASPVSAITVEADDGRDTTLVTRLSPPRGSAFGWGSTPTPHRDHAATAILVDATSTTAVEAAGLPVAEFADTFPAMASNTALQVSRTEVRAWLRDWFREHPDRAAPAAFAVLLDHDLALRPDPARLSTLR